jgi:uncharacterized protein (TIGR00661 family)
VRIAYGVFGYGRGHATRALGVLPGLAERHELLVVAGGDAAETLRPVWPGPIVPVPILRYVYDQDGRRAALPTLRDNVEPVVDLLRRGPHLRAVEAALRAFAPDVLVCDAEPWTHRAAAALGIPIIAFDHYGVLVHGRLPVPLADRFDWYRDVAAYRALFPASRRVLVSSFFDAPVAPGVRCVGPILRDEVRRARPRRGEHLLVYFNRGDHQLTHAIERALRRLALPVIVYGTSRRERRDNLDFRAPAHQAFVDDLAGCRAVLSTAGNQLVGEAVHLGKPMLVVPEQTVEQRLNAAAVVRLGIGARVAHEDLHVDVLRDFLTAEDAYRANLPALARDGRGEAVTALAAFAGELLRERRAGRAAGAVRFA